MTTPLIGDASDRPIELAKGKRVNYWTVEQWLDYLRRNPDATLPAGVGGAIVAHFVGPGKFTVDLLSGPNARPFPVVERGTPVGQ